MLSGEDEFSRALRESVAGLGIEPLTDSQLQQMRLHYELLAKWNSRVNLTRIVVPREAARLHYAESIYGYSLLRGTASVLDVGSGAGFPAVPLAIMNGGLRVTALESNQKKSVFLKEVKQQLALSNLRIEIARIEDLEWSGFPALASRALDRAQEMYAGLVRKLNPGQVLMLFCSDSMMEALSSGLPPGIETESHRIPHSQSRLITLFRRAAVKSPGSVRLPIQS
jgi:16S rRNA (guanine(527)-N(7))-methyltransferase RsmG